MSRPVLDPAALRYVGPEIARDDSELRLILAIHRHGLAASRFWLDYEFEGLSQAEAVVRTGLSQPSVSTLAKGLRERGLLLAGSNGMVLNPRAGIAFGVDIGSQQVRVAVSDLHGQLRAGSDKPPFETLLGENASKSLDWLTRQLDDLAEEARADAPEAETIGVGVSIAGPVDRHSGKLKRAWEAGGDWQFLSATDELKQRLKWDAEFIADRDANASAAAEAIWGVGGGIGDVLYCKWAEGGVSASLIFDHQIFHGGTGIAGEITHSIVPFDETGIAEAENDCLRDWFSGRECRHCGRERCLWAATSIRALRDYLGEPDVEADEIVRRAREYDPVKHRRKSPDEPEGPEESAHHALEAAALCLGRVLAPLIDALNPSLVILGGKIGARAYPMISGVLNKGIAEHGITPAVAAADLSRGSTLLTGKTSVRGAIALALIQAAPRRLHTLARQGKPRASGDGSRAARAA